MYQDEQVREIGPVAEQDRDSTGVVDVLEKVRRRRQRRRRLTFTGFLVLGAMISTVWALGLASTTFEIGSDDDAAVVVGAPSGTTGGTYSAAIDTPEPVQISFTGTWGRLASDFAVYHLDLTDTANTPPGEYFFTIALNNNPQGWVALQFEWVAFEIDDDVADCTVSTVLTGVTEADKQVMAIQDQDASAVFTGLEGDTEWCIGLREITPRASDPDGTFIRRQTAGVAPDVFPSFIGILNRSS